MLIKREHQLNQTWQALCSTKWKAPSKKNCLFTIVTSIMALRLKSSLNLMTIGKSRKAKEFSLNKKANTEKESKRNGSSVF